jgi:cytochrome c peroxidase
MGGGGMRSNAVVMLGKMIFFDENLSEPRGQSCATCHDPSVGFTGPDSTINAGGAVMPGAFPGRFGNRKPPSAAYATPAPLLDYDETEGLFFGGVFWDGRATGWRLGSPTAEQALGPFLNPLEQNLPDREEVLARICGGHYGSMFRKVWGAKACDPKNVEKAYDYVGLSVAAFEDSPMVNRYSSKFDRVLRGTDRFTPREQAGFELFDGKAKCSLCHVLEPAERPLFTDNTFDNLGVPKNPQNPFYTQPAAFNPAGDAWVDLGLGAFLATLSTDRVHADWAALAPENFGKQRVPTLRNVDKRPYPGFVKAFTHNGSFKSLADVVHFYNTRDVLDRCPEGFAGKVGVTCWPAPEVEENVNDSELGDLGLTPDEERALVAFLRTLSDE